MNSQKKNHKFLHIIGDNPILQTPVDVKKNDITLNNELKELENYFSSISFDALFYAELNDVRRRERAPIIVLIAIGLFIYLLYEITNSPSIGIFGILFLIFFIIFIPIYRYHSKLPTSTSDKEKFIQEIRNDQYYILSRLKTKKN